MYNSCYRPEINGTLKSRRLRSVRHMVRREENSLQGFSGTTVWKKASGRTKGFDI